MVTPKISIGKGKSGFLLTGTALNMLDSWLPVVSGLSSRGIRGSVLFPYEFILSRADPSDVTLSIADEVFDSVFVFSNNQLHRFGSIAAALERFGKPDPSMEPVGVLVSWWAKQVRRFLDQLTRIARGSAEKCAKRIIKEVEGKTLLYDVTIRTREQMFHDLVEMHAESSGFRIFSIPHAPVPVMATEQFAERVPEGWTHVSHVRASQTKEKALSAGGLVKCGIPRHDPEWAKKLISRSQELHGDPKRPYMVLLSHGGGPHYPFSEEAKIEVIEEIGAQLKKKGMELIVKKHPTEELGPGKNYSVSGAHPLHLLQNAEGMISFLTSTVADGLFFRKPIIQVLGIVAGLSGNPSPKTWAEDVGAVISCGSMADFSQLLDEVESFPAGLKEMAPQKYCSLLLKPNNEYLVSIIESSAKC